MKMLQILVVLLAATAVVLAAACEGNYKMAPSAPAAMGERDMAGVGAMSTLKEESAPQLPSNTQTTSVIPSMIIRNGNVSIQIDSLEAAVEGVRLMATRLGGYIGNVNMNTGEQEIRSATLQMKVPAERFDEAMSGMSALGKVEHSGTTAEDVSEEFFDVKVRMANSRRVEERLVTLLASRAGSLEDVLAVERELARVRQEIERMEGRIRFLSARVAMSTIDVTVHEKAPLIGNTPGTNILGRAFRNSWRNFVHFVAFVIESLGVLIPVGVAAWLIVRRVGRRKVPAAG